MLKDLREFRPSYAIYAECYHYEDRVNAVAAFDGKGKELVAFAKESVKVITHNQWAPVAVDDPQDLTENLNWLLHSCSVVKLTF